MSAATITLTDEGDQVSLNLEFTGGFNPGSQAQRCAMELVAHMDTLGKRQESAEEAIQQPQLKLVAAN